MVGVLGGLGDVALHPVDLAREVVGNRVVVGNQGTPLLSDVARIVPRKAPPRRTRARPLPDSLAVDEQLNRPALPEPSALVGELHSNLVRARWDLAVGVDVEKRWMPRRM